MNHDLFYKNQKANTFLNWLYDQLNCNSIVWSTLHDLIVKQKQIQQNNNSKLILFLVKIVIKNTRDLVLVCTPAQHIKTVKTSFSKIAIKNNNRKTQLSTQTKILQNKTKQQDNN